MKQEIIQSVLNCDSLDHVLEKCSIYINNPLVLITETFDIIAYANHIDVQDEIWNKAVNRGYITLEFGTVLSHFPNPDTNGKYHCITTNSINLKNRRFYKVELNNMLLGYLNILEEYQDLNECNHEQYDFIVAVLAKELYINQNIALKNTNERFFMKLVRKNFVDYNHYKESISKTTINPTKKHRVLNIDLNHFISYEAKNDLFKNELLTMFPNAITIMNDRILSILIEEPIISINDLFDEIKLNFFCIKHNIKIGCSDAFDDLFNCTNYNQNALDCLILNTYLIEQQPVIFYSDVAVYDLITKSNKEDLLKTCNNNIFSIYEYDQKEGTDFLKTLFIYIATKHSIKETANTLFIHRNTVTYRIQRIKELFDIHLDKPFNEFDYYFSCQIIQVVDNNFIKL